MAIKEVILPKLGQTMEFGTIIEWLKQEGDQVQRGEVLFTVESDKATLEVESPTKGYLRKILVPAGEEHPVLIPVALITKEADEDISSWQAGKSAGLQIEESANERMSESVVQTKEISETSQVSDRIFSSPRARKLARERGVELALVAGSGPNGRIVERDIVTYLESTPKATPVAQRVAEQAGVDLREVQGSGPGGRITKTDVEGAAVPAPPVHTVAAAPTTAAEVPMSGVRSVIARRMHAGHSETAPVTLTMEVDATDLVQIRERLKASLADKLGFSIGYNDLLIKIVARALREFPYMNARLDGDTIHQLGEVHVALAVDTERGLLVPVVRDADRKGMAEFAAELRDVIERARAGTALPDELSGSTFTITNLGMFEVDAFTPIINLPEAAILGVGRIKDYAAVVEGEIAVRKMMWLSLTFDHRLVDGAPAARFLQRIKQYVEEPYLLLA
ncbi:MAG: dihydrolipoamide acetyltransferase family protein [Anaerolineae bacterium]|jgi:pyruvate dehydrogenase E2 component (dihydrolipoamide acetyltransferase)